MDDGYLVLSDRAQAFIFSMCMSNSKFTPTHLCISGFTFAFQEEKEKKRKEEKRKEKKRKEKKRKEKKRKENRVKNIYKTSSRNHSDERRFWVWF